MWEIEVKVRAKNLEDIAQKLSEAGCALSAPLHQYDTIYSYGESTSEWETSKEGHIVMRIRRENDRAEFNLKQQRSNELDNLEYETEVNDPQAMQKILLTLGYRPQVEVKKVRRKTKYGEYEICLDEVERLGAFVEIEKLAEDDADPKEAQEELMKTLESLGLKREDQEMRGYDTQIFQLEHRI